MSARKLSKGALLAVLVASSVLLAMSSAHALPTIEEPAPVGVTVPYPGRLEDTEGRPVADGAYDFTFALYAEEIGGEALWSEMQPGVAVEDGAFAVLLGGVEPIPAGVVGGGEGWLEVGVRGPGEVGFTTLTPRQRLTAAPTTSQEASADMACPHDHWNEEWSGGGGAGLTLRSSSGIGVYGVSSSGYGVAGSTSNGYAVYGVSTDGYSVYGTSTDGLAVYGTSTNSTGVTGESTNSYGVHGFGGNVGVFGTATGESEFSYGVFATSTNGPGVYGDSTDGQGVHGQSANDNGVYGESTYEHGVRGETHGQYNWRSGVFGEAYNDVSNGVTGWNESGGVGVYGLSDEEGYAGYFSGKVRVTGNLEKPGGGFKIDHPLDPADKYLNHSFVESPDMKNVYDGVVVLDEGGSAWVDLPEWFEALNEDFRYQLTCIGGFAPVYVAREIQGNRFQIAGGAPGLKVSWQVTGIRHDAYAEAHRIPVEEEKPPEEQGTYLHPEEQGMPETSGLDYQRNHGIAQADEGGER
jgi:hypothetical protein